MTSAKNNLLSLRKMQKKDVEMILRWRNDYDVRRFMLSQHEITLDEHNAWFLKASSDAKRHLLIVEKGHKPVGFVNFVEVWQGGIFDWSFHAAPDAVKGTGTQLAFAALDYAFNVAGFHKVCGQVLEFNVKSLGLHRKLGFKEEGCLRSQFYDGSFYHDMYCFGMLSDEWAKIKSSL